jgi:Xaa-Pro aminopeptidase
MTSERERARRYASLHLAMDSEGLQALVICGRGDKTARGRLQYVSDVQWTWGRGYCILPRHVPPVMFTEPIWSVDNDVSWAGWITDCRQGSADTVKDVADALDELGLSHGRVGLVGQDELSPEHCTYLLDRLAKAEVSNADPLFDRARARKSAEEISHLKDTSRLLSTAFETLISSLRPGVSEREVLAEAHRYLRAAGCSDGLALIARTPFTSFTTPTEELIRGDETLVIGLDYAGPAGYWCEMRRCYSFGPPSEAARDFWDARVAAFHAGRQALKPGGSGGELLDAVGAVYRDYGFENAGIVTWTAHGTGLDVIEPPTVPGSHWQFEDGMVLSLHPAVRLTDDQKRAVGRIAVADNVLVTPEGGARLTDTPLQWTEL